MLELRILNGLHRGGSLLLDEGRVVLGASLEADIEIVDPGIKESHCAIEYLAEKDIWCVHAIEGNFSTGPDHRHSNWVEVHQGLVIKMGGIYVGFFDSLEPWDLERYNRPEVMQSEAKSHNSVRRRYKQNLGLFIISGSLITYALASVDSNEKGATTELALAAAVQSESGIRTKTEPEPAIDVMHELKYMLRQRGLSQKVRLTGSENQWVISGSLTKDDLATLSRMVNRFKTTYPGIELVDSTSTPANTLPFEIRSVSSGLYAHVLTSEGKRIYIGDEIAGFTLKKIEKDRLLFSGESDVELIW